jgi:hypothetical protein
MGAMTMLKTDPVAWLANELNVDEEEARELFERFVASARQP